MLNLLDLQTRRDVAGSIREHLERGELASATIAIDKLIDESGDADLMQAARASAESTDLDWVGVCAEAIEADVRLQSLHLVGCRHVVLELGNTAQRRSRIVRYYYGPPPLPEKPTADRRTRGRLGAAHGILEHEMMVTGLEQLARIQLSGYPSIREEQARHQRSTMLAGHLLVLRFFGAVERGAQRLGFPFPARLQVAVESLGGEEAINSLDPQLSTELRCSVHPISRKVEDRLRRRHEMQVVEWHQRTDKLLVDLRWYFEAHGYAPSRMLPDELAEKERLQKLERTLTLFEPGNRMTWPQFEALLVRVRKVRDETVPAPIDPTPYR